ncbi:MULTISPECIES: SEC-C metal-binding domain-containing protein [unclassified Pseudoalteromonas]|uniref:SEC-C metal-binding domain-containing protein n=1 Tax=unclassified Pseudoalteromonas TaxID=194690 RepID=UPI0009E4F0D1|nr:MULTISPECIES: SEC-C metal-binding domain-containing protein [unclassified Pseudoalteromonas]
MSERSNNLSETSLESEGSSCTNTSCCPPPQSPLTRATPKIGRNDPCICGNGRKYKKCCGKNA